MGDVEVDEESGEREAVEEGVETASGICGRRGEIDGAAADRVGLQSAGRMEKSVTCGFEVESLSVPSPEEGVGFIDAGVVRRVVGAEAEGLGGEKEAVKFLDRPVVIHEPDGEGVEEWLEVGGGLLRSEVTKVGKGGAEVPVPDAVDDDPGSEGVGAVRDSFGHGEARAFVVGVGLASEDGGPVARERFVAVGGIAAVINLGGAPLFAIAEGHGAGWGAGVAGLKAGEGAVAVPLFVAVGLIEELPDPRGIVGEWALLVFGELAQLVVLGQGGDPFLGELLAELLGIGGAVHFGCPAGQAG